LSFGRSPAVKFCARHPGIESLETEVDRVGSILDRGLHAFPSRRWRQDLRGVPARAGVIPGRWKGKPRRTLAAMTALVCWPGRAATGISGPSRHHEFAGSRVTRPSRVISFVPAVAENIPDHPETEQSGEQVTNDTESGVAEQMRRNAGRGQSATTR